MNRPSIELAMVAANVAVAVCLAVVYLTGDAPRPDSALPDDSLSGPDQPPVLIAVAAGRSTESLLVKPQRRRSAVSSSLSRGPA